MGIQAVRFIIKTALLFLSLVASIHGAASFWQSRDSNYNLSIGGSPPPSCTPGTNASAYMARLSGGDATADDICTFVNGLDTDSLFTKFDTMQILGLANSSNAVINVVSTSFTATPTNSPTFAANKGYTGVAGSTTVWIDTGLVGNAGTQFTQDNASISIWLNSDVADASNVCLGLTAGTTSITQLYPKSGGVLYSQVNTNGFGGSTVSATNAVGFYTTSRPDSSHVITYKDGSQVISDSSGVASAGPPAVSFAVLASHDSGGSVAVGCGNQVSFYAIGASLSSTEAANLNTRIHTFASSRGW